MPNPPFQATAEGLPTRRQFLKSTAGAAVALCAGTATAAALDAESASQIAEDQKAELIRLWRSLSPDEKLLMRELCEAMVEENLADTPSRRFVAKERLVDIQVRIERHKAMKRAAA